MVCKAKESPLVTVSQAAPFDVNVLNTVDIELPGPHKFKEGSTDSTPGTPQVLITASPTAGTSWRIRRIEMVSRAYSSFDVKIGVNTIKAGRTSPGEATISLQVEPWATAVPADVVTFNYSQIDGPAVPITARIYYTEH